MKKGRKTPWKEQSRVIDEEIPLGDLMDPDLILSFPCILKPTDKIPAQRERADVAHWVNI